jgi:hypothetical protein
MREVRRKLPAWDYGSLANGSVLRAAEPEIYGLCETVPTSHSWLMNAGKITISIRMLGIRPIRSSTNSVGPSEASACLYGAFQLTGPLLWSHLSWLIDAGNFVWSLEMHANKVINVIEASKCHNYELDML